jgi:hypothetical protein
MDFSEVTRLQHQQLNGDVYILHLNLLSGGGCGASEFLADQLSDQKIQVCVDDYCKSVDAWITWKRVILPGECSSQQMYYTRSYWSEKVVWMMTNAIIKDLYIKIGPIDFIVSKPPHPLEMKSLSKYKMVIRPKNV